MAEIDSLGLLGCGHMGGALARGALSAKLLPSNRLFVFDPQPEALRSLEALGCWPAASPLELFQKAGTVVLAVKPQVFKQMAVEWKRAFASLPAKIVISVMAGIRLANLREVFPPSCTLIRVMPNLGLSVGQGATAIASDGLTEETLRLAENLFRASGITVRVAENQLDAVTGLSGSGPMYVFEFVEGLTQAGVKSGLAPETAYALARQTVKGSLKLLENSEDVPPVWTKKVCSPGGTTERALAVLEQQGFKDLLGKAVEAAMKRSKELSK